MDGNTVSLNDAVAQPKTRGISGSTIKLVAIFTMLIDHTAATILEKIISKNGMYDYYSDNNILYNIYSLMRSIGRLAFPIFCFLLVEGLIHTRNKWKYALRMALFAVISEVPFDLAFANKPIFWGYQSVYFTLLIGLLVMIGFEYIGNVFINKKWFPILSLIGVIIAGLCTPYFLTSFFAPRFMGYYSEQGLGKTESIIMSLVFCAILLLIYFILCKKKSNNTVQIIFAYCAVLIAGMFLAYFLKTDYSEFGVLTVAIMYFLRKNKFNSMMGGCLTLTVMSYGEIASLLDLILIRYYNGKRGLNLKYVFYLFYPVHLFILYLICYFTNLV
ncbi:MAG TPA: TraX family protein [Lachnospiraceae bacterium]|nr:TraX family protein [Lachnospiraceae bacterium]